jgi:hypothetical protein
MSPEEIEKLAQADFTKFKEEFKIKRPMMVKTYFGYYNRCNFFS